MTTRNEKYDYWNSVQGGRPRISRGRGGSAECVCGEGVFGLCGRVCEQCANRGVCCSVPSPMEAMRTVCEPWCMLFRAIIGVRSVKDGIHMMVNLYTLCVLVWGIASCCVKRKKD